MAQRMVTKTNKTELFYNQLPSFTTWMSNKDQDIEMFPILPKPSHQTCTLPKGKIALILLK